MLKQVLACVCLVGCVPVDDEVELGESSSELTWAQLKAKIDAVPKGDYVGMSIIVVHGGTSGIFHYGEKIIGQGPPANDTIYAMGSMTKTVTATLLALDDHEGVLGLDNLLDPYTAVPLSGGRQEIRLRQLGTHHAGLPRDQPSSFDYTTGTYAGDMTALMNSLADCTNSVCMSPALSPVNGEYSNYGYAVLGRVLAGIHFPSNPNVRNAQRLVLDRFGMDDTDDKQHLTQSMCVLGGACPYSAYGECSYLPACNGTFHPRAAIGYIGSELPSGVVLYQRDPDEGSDQTIKAGSGVLWTTPADMMKWLKYHMGVSAPPTPAFGDILEVLHEPTPGNGNMALSFRRRSTRNEGHPVVAKSGELDSFNSYIEWVDGGSTGVVVLINSNKNSEILADDVIDALLP